VIEVGTAAGDYDGVAERVNDRGVDTVVHAGLTRWRPHLDADVIGTMRLAAAVSQPGCTVRVIVAASSTAAYPASSRAPRLRRETEQLDAPPDSVAGRLLEAEGYLRRLAVACPHVCVAVLRLADLAGATPVGPLPTLLRRCVAPAIAGFDPPIQLLDLDDAAAALVHAADRSLAGIYNVAGRGELRWSEAARRAGRISVPIVPPPSWVSGVASRLGLAWLDADTIATLRYGRTVDTALLTAAGYAPARSSAACATALDASVTGRA
jgi:UDP-glucose 4-epimerase